MPTNLKGTYIRTSDSVLNLLHLRASLSGLPLSQFLIEKGLSDGLSFDPNLRHLIQRIAFESFIIREELPHLAKSILSLHKLLSLAPYKADNINDANQPNQSTSIRPSSPSSPNSPSSPHTPSSSDLHQLFQQLSLLFDKLAFSTEFLISLFGDIKHYPDILRNLHSISDRNPHLLSTSLNFDFSPSSTSDSSNRSYGTYPNYSNYCNFAHFASYFSHGAFLSIAPSSWAFSSASLLKSKPLGLALGSALSLVNSQAYGFSLGHPYSLLS